MNRTTIRRTRMMMRIQGDVEHEDIDKHEDKEEHADTEGIRSAENGG